ncbi:MAG: M67 family metallopeptidase [Armatimonadota bacterium]
MSGDDLDLDIKLQDARPRAVLDAPPPEQDPAFAVRVAGYPSAEFLRVYLHIEVMRAVEAHAASYPEREVGGVLLGKFAVYQDRPYVRVEEVVLGLKAAGSATQLTFTHETWRQINEAKDKEHPELQIVGWYHSHPDLGIFLSRDDLYIHKNFFANERQVALVVDPINHDRGLFVWHHGEVKRDGGLRIFAPAANTLVLEQFVNAIHAPKTGRIVVQDTPAAAPAKAGPQQPVVVKVEFHDASITPFALLPRSWRAFFGVYDLRTAPRVSLKSLVILILCVVILAMWLRPNVPPAAAGAGKPPAHAKAPKNGFQQLWDTVTNWFTGGEKKKAPAAAPKTKPPAGEQDTSVTESPAAPLGTPPDRESTTSGDRTEGETRPDPPNDTVNETPESEADGTI